MAMGQHGGGFYGMLRPVMFGLGAIVAGVSWNAGEPAWVPALFFVAGGVSLLRLGSFWPVANVLVALAYIAHLAWLSFQAIGWA